MNNIRFIPLQHLGWGFLLAWVFCVFYTGATSDALGVQDIRFTAKLAEPVKKNHSRTDIQRGIISRQEDGTWLAAPCGSQDSHRIYQVSRANAYLVLPAESGSLPAGAEVTVQPFAEAFL